ncbi:hypothetical protein QTI66_14955 [Variovorax sp. J22R133]|uniref:hypothetical protein n=1 Tax=Variovorax brevis TaxID=3053503 RepID=UPI0025755556|nr:hypothetical protein [Variovorax sp. J22R133]MDM0113456.1 hypothetical protein [Variovorax sp. J22R133]
MAGAIATNVNLASMSGAVLAAPEGDVIHKVAMRRKSVSLLMLPPTRLQTTDSSTSRKER